MRILIRLKGIRLSLTPIQNQTPTPAPTQPSNKALITTALALVVSETLPFLPNEANGIIDTGCKLIIDLFYADR